MVIVIFFYALLIVLISYNLVVYKTRREVVIFCYTPLLCRILLLKARKKPED